MDKSASLAFRLINSLLHRQVLLKLIELLVERMCQLDMQQGKILGCVDSLPRSKIEESIFARCCKLPIDESAHLHIQFTFHCYFTIAFEKSTFSKSSTSM